MVRQYSKAVVPVKKVPTPLAKYRAASVLRSALYNQRRLSTTIPRPLPLLPLASTEKKCQDTVVASPGTAFTVTGTIEQIGIVAQGTDINQRIGRKIRMQYLDLRLNTFVTAIGTSQWRVLVVYDRENNALTPTVADVLADVGTGSLNPNTPLNINNRNRFLVLRDHNCGMISNTELADQWVHLFVPLNGMETIYNGTNTGVFGAIQSGALFLLFINDLAASAAYTYNARVRFTDA